MGEAALEARRRSPGALPGIVRACGSPLAIATLAAPLVTAVGWGLARRDLDGALDARAFRAWTAVLAVSIGCAALRAALARRWGALSIAAGLLALVAQGEMTRLWRFEGTASAGEGEAAVRWRTYRSGALAPVPELGPVEFDPAPDAVVVRSAGEGVRIPRGASARLRGAEITVREIGAAPAFEIRSADGTPLESGLVELSDTERGYIEVPALPHRFYFSLPAGAARRRDGGLDQLRVRVQRGKLEVLDAVLRPGAAGDFEGLGVTWSEGGRWALLEVRRTPRPLLALAGLALVVEGALASWLLRRRA